MTKVFTHGRTFRVRILPLAVAGVIAIVALGTGMLFQAQATTEPVASGEEKSPIESENSAGIDVDSLYQAKTSESMPGDSSSIQALEPTRTINGHVSWYGSRFHGRRTANGERFDMNEMTAAHKSLPFNTIVRVVDTRTDQAVLVRVNDRGPYIRGRVLDLSREAAGRLGMRGRGTTSGRLEIFNPEPVADASATGESKESVEYVTFDASLRGVKCDGWTVIVDEVDRFHDAVGLHETLSEQYDDVFLTQIETNGTTRYMVSVGLYGVLRFCRDLNVELRSMYSGARIARFENGYPTEQSAAGDESSNAEPLTTSS